jgi:hypothetical protein
MKNNLSKKRKMLLALPMVVLPLVSLLLWATGIVGSTDAKGQLIPSRQGLNTSLPDAKLEDPSLWSKMRAYQAADADSSAQRERVQNDLRATGFGYGDSGSADTLADHAYQKLEELKQIVNSPTQMLSKQKNNSVVASTYEPNVTAIEKIMQAPKAETKTEKDAELDALSQMMEKIMDIQHPERVTERSQSVKRETLAARKAVAGTGAVITETQVLVSGSIVKLRLTDSLVIDSVVIPKNSMVNGVGRLNAERLEIEIKSLRAGSVIIPVNFCVFDLDGIAGIYVPGAINRETAKETAASALGGFDVLTADPSIKAQATATGISAVKNLFTKKARLVRVQVRSGYRVLLREPLN